MAIDGETYGEAYFSTTYPDYFRQNPARKLGFYRSVVEQHLPPRIPIRVLDVGCGLGGFLACLRESDPDRGKFTLTGLDVSQFAIAHNAARYPGETFEVGAAESIGDFGQRFDVVTAFDVLEHVPEPDAAAAAISNCLVDDGIFILVVPVYDGPLGPVVKRLDRDGTHLQVRSRQWWLQWTDAHFDLIGWLGIFRLLLPWNQYIHVPTRAFRRVAPAILVTATRRHPESGRRRTT